MGLRGLEGGTHSTNLRKKWLTSKSRKTAMGKRHCGVWGGEREDEGVWSSAYPFRVLQHLEQRVPATPHKSEVQRLPAQCRMPSRLRTPRGIPKHLPGGSAWGWQTPATSGLKRTWA